MCAYRSRGKIHWAKYSQLNRHRSFRGNIFALPWPQAVHKYSLFSIIKKRHLYLRKNFRGTPENREKRENLAQQIFPRLRYMHACMSVIIFNLFSNINEDKRKTEKQMLLFEVIKEIEDCPVS